MKIELERHSATSNRMNGKLSGALTRQFQIFADLEDFHGKAWMTYDGEVSETKEEIIADELLIDKISRGEFAIDNHFQVRDEELEGRTYRTLVLRVRCQSEKTVQLHLCFKDGYVYAFKIREYYTPDDDTDEEYMEHVTKVARLNGEYFFSEL